MICWKCKKDIEEADNYCRYCGAGQGGHISCFALACYRQVCQMGNIRFNGIAFCVVLLQFYYGCKESYGYDGTITFRQYGFYPSKLCAFIGAGLPRTVKVLLLFADTFTAVLLRR